ncbi:hypothetical protein [Pseudomonas sp. CC6-YY-74]|uniref:hypothetical protein n=1 Tax=Pseudomonas sp. CC6-YY-74 TaxID=1930532 RepID=UPI0009A1609D|nr:hypothetical protein [Pseudomonas sp. CC6-YY-74]
MHAEEDDVPEYLRTKKQGPSRALAIVAIGSVITSVLMLIFVKPVVIDVAQLKKAIRFADQPVFDEPAQFVEQAPMQQLIAPQYKQQQRQPIAPQYTQHKPEPATLWVPRGSTPEQKPQARQTSFNDRNYTPSNPINILNFPEAPTQAASEPVKQKMKVTVIGQTDRKDICDIFKSGSLERRGCRQQIDLNYRSRN